MKKIIIFSLPLVALVLLVYLMHGEDKKTEEPAKSEVHAQIDAIVNKYGDRAYKSFYSIEELRPYSIVQIDKVIELFDNTWLSPKIILAKLTPEDKEILKNKVIEYIDSFDDENKKKFTISKITNWCRAETQFNFLNDEMGIINDNIITALRSVNNNKQLVTKYSENKSGKNDDFSPEQKDFAYYQTLNLISVMSLSDQMKYYGDVYNQLAVLCSK